MTRQDQRFPDLHEPDEGGPPSLPAAGQAPAQPPRFAEIFAPAPELPEPPAPAVPAEPRPREEMTDRTPGSPAPTSPFVDDENPFGPSSDRSRGPRRGRDPGASFEELVSEMFPPEEPAAPALLVEEPRGSRLRWIALALLVVVAAAGAYHYRGPLLAVVRGGGAATGAAPAVDGPEVLPAPTEAAVPTAVAAELPTPAPEPTAVPEPPSATPAAPAVDPASLVPATRIRAARWEGTRDGGVVVLQANGGVVARRIRHLRLEDPPRELVRISGIVGPTEPDTISVDGALVSRIRLGHHPELSPPELYVVIDLASPAARGATPEPSGDTIRIPVR